MPYRTCAELHRIPISPPPALSPGDDGWDRLARVAADHARELAAFARAGFSRRVAEAVLACADVEALEALARDGVD